MSLAVAFCLLLLDIHSMVLVNNSIYAGSRCQL